MVREMVSGGFQTRRPARGLVCPQGRAMWALPYALANLIPRPGATRRTRGVERLDTLLPLHVRRDPRYTLDGRLAPDDEGQSKKYNRW